ncbi:MAG: hypothetical protein IJH68_02820 [Thermoguttaceae bacterium]|nr:hypothetical protein [Thermoguttaceae bacterium]
MRFLSACLSLSLGLALLVSASAQEVFPLGADRELFCDDTMIAAMSDCQILVHQPVPQELAFTCDKPWEGNCCNYWTFLYDDQAKIYRAYAVGCSQGDGVHPPHRPVIVTYESEDGIHWTCPNIGLFEWEGLKDNNIILFEAADQTECHDFSPFIDTNPNAKPEARYKAVGRSLGFQGLFAYQSPDGIHWTPASSEPVYTDGAFDTQNITFWSEKEQKYILYYRIFSEGGYNGTRMIARAVSDDYLHWTNEGPIVFPEGEGPVPEAQYYTNGIRPYYRAKNVCIGFPARYVDNGLIRATEFLSEWDRRQERMTLSPRYGTAVTDAVYITSRDGKHFRRSNEAFLSPGLKTKDNWVYGDNYLAWTAIETDSLRDDCPRELSLYATESYFTGTASGMRRFTLRIDGFGSVHAMNKIGEMVTRPFTFTGKELSLNLGTAAAGFVKMEFLDEGGNPIPGFTLDECDMFFGDTLDWRCSWNGSTDVSPLAGKTVSLRFVMREADLYSMKFEQ